MNEDEYEDDDCEETEYVAEVAAWNQDGVHSESFLWNDLACIGVRWVANLVTCATGALETTAGALHGVANVIGMDANYRRGQRDFARSVGASIEKITGGPDGRD